VTVVDIQKAVEMAAGAKLDNSKYCQGKYYFSSLSHKFTEFVESSVLQEKIKIGFHHTPVEHMFKVICMKIGIIGCGNIAHHIAKNVGDVVAVYDIYPEKCGDMNTRICESVQELISLADIIVEAASPAAVEKYAMEIVKSGKSMVIMSIGGLVDPEFREKLFEAARENGARIYLPSGAIGGIDLIKTARIAGLRRVLLRSTKNAKTLGYEVEGKTLIFRGKASEAIKKFPKSVNVSVLLSIVSGMDIDVEVYADPNARENVHEIVVEGEFGVAEIKVKNKPSPANPRTSYLAAFSPVYLLNSLGDVIRMGV